MISKQLLHTLIFSLIAIPLVGQTTISEEESLPPESNVEATTDSSAGNTELLGEEKPRAAFIKLSFKKKAPQPSTDVTNTVSSPVAGVTGDNASMTAESATQVPSITENNLEKESGVPFFKLSWKKKAQEPSEVVAEVLPVAEPTEDLLKAEPSKIDAVASVVESSHEENPILVEDASLASDESIVNESNDLIEVARTDRIDRELSNIDIASYQVLIRPNDYLGKISMREYATPNRWRHIYQWNKELIGDDPNVIHPYDQLVLYKPENEIIDPSYDFVIHAAARGETLWSIAQNWYGDNLAWKVVYTDNAEQLKSSGGRLVIGMELKIRTILIEHVASEYRLSSRN